MIYRLLIYIKIFNYIKFEMKRKCLNNNLNNINSDPDYNNFYEKFINKSNSNSNSNSSCNSESNSELDNNSQNKAVIGCRISGAYIFWKKNKIDLDEFNMQNPKVSALLGSYCNQRDIIRILNNVKDEDKLKLVEIDINNSNNDELESLDTNLQKNGSCICTLFNYKQGIKDPRRKFNYQPLHTFTLEYNNDKYTLHQSWFDGIINHKRGFKYKELTYIIDINAFNNLISTILDGKKHEEKESAIKELFFKNIPQNSIPDNTFDFLEGKKFMLLYMYLEKY